MPPPTQKEHRKITSTLPHHPPTSACPPAHDALQKSERQPSTPGLASPRGVYVRADSTRHPAVLVGVHCLRAHSPIRLEARVSRRERAPLPADIVTRRHRASVALARRHFGGVEGGHESLRRRQVLTAGRVPRRLCARRGGRARQPRQALSHRRLDYHRRDAGRVEQLVRAARLELPLLFAYMLAPDLVPSYLMHAARDLRTTGAIQEGDTHVSEGGGGEMAARLRGRTISTLAPKPAISRPHAPAEHTSTRAHTHTRTHAHAHTLSPSVSLCLPLSLGVCLSFCLSSPPPSAPAATAGRPGARTVQVQDSDQRFPGGWVRDFQI